MNEYLAYLLIGEVVGWWFLFRLYLSEEVYDGDIESHCDKPYIELEGVWFLHLVITPFLYPIFLLFILAEYDKKRLKKKDE